MRGNKIPKRTICSTTNWIKRHFKKMPTRYRNSLVWQSIKRQFYQRWKPSQIVYQLALDVFLFTGAAKIALLFYPGGNLPMIQNPLLVALFVSLGVALLTLARIKMESKDTRLDTLIIKVDALTQRIDNLLDKDTADKLIKAIQGLTEELRNRRQSNGNN